MLDPSRTVWLVCDCPWCGLEMWLTLDADGAAFGWAEHLTSDCAGLRELGLHGCAAACA